MFPIFKNGADSFRKDDSLTIIFISKGRENHQREENSRNSSS